MRSGSNSWITSKYKDVKSFYGLASSFKDFGEAYKLEGNYNDA